MPSRQKSKFSRTTRAQKTDESLKLKSGYILYSNANGLVNKMCELRTCVTTYGNIDIICITETHLKNTILDAEINIEGFKFFRKDRNFNISNNATNEGECIDKTFSSGGGCIIYYRNNLEAKLVKTFSERVPDSLAIKIDSNIGDFCVALFTGHQT